jgi:hypothetical protein
MIMEKIKFTIEKEKKKEKQKLNMPIRKQQNTLLKYAFLPLYLLKFIKKCVRACMHIM